MIGHDEAATLSKVAFKENKSIREVALERSVLSVESSTSSWTTEA